MIVIIVVKEYRVKLDIESRFGNVKSKAPVTFKGYKFTKSDMGFREFEVSYPFDENKDNCYLEVYKVEKDPYGNYYTTGRAYTKKGDSRIKLKSGKNNIDLVKTFGFNDNQDFAYRYILEDKNSKFTKKRVDAGDVIQENRGETNLYNIVSLSKSNLSKGGSMKLVIIDSQKVGYVYNDKNLYVKNDALEKRGQEGIKTITNKFGGTLAGLEYAIDNGEYDNYGRIISLPVFTDDDFTAHSYWNKNCMQMASSLGNINNYASLQRKMFAHDLNFVSDGAFVNEGLQGVHFTNILKWGEESPYFNWFRSSGLSSSPFALGILSKDREYISHKIVNSPYKYKETMSGDVITRHNSKYDKTKPTYIQFFDKRLVTEEEALDNEHLIKTYSKMSTPNVYDLHSHNDSVFPYSFEIDPEIYNMNVKGLNEINKMNLKSSRPKFDYYGPVAAKLLAKNKNFIVEGKFESGFETWDANTDIAKLNFVFSNDDVKTLKNLTTSGKRAQMDKILRGNAQVQDYVINSGKYWTRKTDEILRLHIAHNLKNLDGENPSLVYENIMKIADGKTFPKSLKAELSKEEVENVLDGFYNNKRVLSDENSRTQIIRGLMDTPLDSIELGDNLVSVLGSPLITKRANVKSEIGVSRFDIYKYGNKNLPKEYAKTYNKMDNIYTEEMSDYAYRTLKLVNEEMPEGSKLFDGKQLTDFGKYVVPILTSEIAKYAVVKSFSPKAEFRFDAETGEISYNYNDLKQISLQTIGITNPSSPQEEAMMVLDKLSEGIKNLKISKESELTQSLISMLKGTNLNSFKLADLIIDKTQAGLDWRIDATKDIADVESLRNLNTNFEQTWQHIIDFWKQFTQAVIAENPNAYMVSEVTDEGSLYSRGYGSKSKKYPKSSDINPKFLRETGITSTANYSYWFKPIPELFVHAFENGETFSRKEDYENLLFSNLVASNNRYINAGPLESLMYSYTFIGNHDKPRALHCAALDMKLFNSDLTDDRFDNFENRKKAFMVVNDRFIGDINEWEVRNFDFSGVSPKAVAMAVALQPAFADVLNKYKGNLSEFEFNKAYVPISRAISDLAQGKFLGKRFDPDAFGCKPIDVNISMVLKQAKEMYDYQPLPGTSANLENEVFENIMNPAISKVLGMMKFLVALPGMPTLFDGDDVGATGYDTKTKNMYLQGRQRVHDEWLDTESIKYKDFIAKYKEHFDNVMKLRKMPECNALNNGGIFVLPQNYTQDNKPVTSIFRESPDGRMAISIFNLSGFHTDVRKPYMQENLYLDRLYFNQNDEGTIGIAGLREGTKFVNANDKSDVYYTRIDNSGQYYLTRHCEGRDVPIILNDTTLILYHVPKGIPLTFTGKFLAQPSAKYVATAYNQKTNDCGKNLAIVK
jgi:hypothetical protein